MIAKRTLRQPVKIIGKGLHSGRIVKLEILPSVEGRISFLRTDTAASQPVVASLENVSSTELSTTIGYGDRSVGTVEHLMAALSGTGVDSALICLNGPEVPILDGSAREFVQRITEVGTREISKSRRFLIINETLEVHEGDKFIRIIPATNPFVRYSIEFDSKSIGQQSFEYKYGLKEFLSLCHARTFCHEDDISLMRNRGLALGGSLQNAVVVSGNGVLNQEGLRSRTEFVEHKTLDLLGDFKLLDCQIVGGILAHKAGHGLHIRALRRLLDHCGSWSEVGTYPLEGAGLCTAAADSALHF